jgi:hypothetical protein
MLLVWVRTKFELNEYVRNGSSNSRDSTVVYEHIGEFNSIQMRKKLTSTSEPPVSLPR